MNTTKLPQNTRKTTPDFRFQDRKTTTCGSSLSRKETPAAARLSHLPPPDVPCAACSRRVTQQQNALDDLHVCAECLRIYTAVDQALNLRADRRTANSRRESMLKKWGKV